MSSFVPTQKVKNRTSSTKNLLDKVNRGDASIVTFE